MSVDASNTTLAGGLAIGGMAATLGSTYPIVRGFELASETRKLPQEAQRLRAELATMRTSKPSAVAMALPGLGDSRELAALNRNQAATGQLESQLAKVNAKLAHAGRSKAIGISVGTLSILVGVAGFCALVVGMGLASRNSLDDAGVPMSAR